MLLTDALATGYFGAQLGNIFKGRAARTWAHAIVYPRTTTPRAHPSRSPATSEPDARRYVADSEQDRGADPGHHR